MAPSPETAGSRLGSAQRLRSARREDGAAGAARSGAGGALAQFGVAGTLSTPPLPGPRLSSPEVTPFPSKIFGRHRRGWWIREWRVRTCRSEMVKGKVSFNTSLRDCGERREGSDLYRSREEGFLKNDHGLADYFTPGETETQRRKIRAQRDIIIERTFCGPRSPGSQPPFTPYIAVTLLCAWQWGQGTGVQDEGNLTGSFYGLSPCTSPL